MHALKLFFILVDFLLFLLIITIPQRRGAPHMLIISFLVLFIALVLAVVEEDYLVGCIFLVPPSVKEKKKPPFRQYNLE